MYVLVPPPLGRGNLVVRGPGPASLLLAMQTYTFMRHFS